MKAANMNTTTNGSSLCSRLINNPAAAKMGETVFWSVILIVSLVGNSLIAVLVYKTATLRKPINYLIVNMAMSDFLFPIVLFSSRLAEFHSFFIGGSVDQAICKVVLLLSYVSFSVSIQSLVLIAVDRFVAVTFPLRSPLISRKLCSFLIPATWIVAMAVYSPNILALKHPGGRECENHLGENHFLAVYIVFHYIPLGLLVTFYTIILIKLKKQSLPGELSTIAEQQRTRRNRNVLKMAVAIVTAFLLCWIPYNVGHLMQIFASGLVTSCIFKLFHYVAYFLMCLNSALNPIICVTFSSNYRQGLNRLLKCFGTVLD